MSVRRKYVYARALLFVGGIVSAVWGVVSLLGLFDLASDASDFPRVVRALGPLGIIMVIVGGALCGWNLPELKKLAQEERE
jgi:hypothetical protein